MSILARKPIPCNAQSLSQLGPEMIQAVAPTTAFSVGFQYYSERRVRIIESGDLKISSKVGGISGQYQQTILLANGSLLVKCSCPSNERPLCRHCVAVLLENYHLASDNEHSSSELERQSETLTQEKVECEAPASTPEPKASALGLSLREITLFIDWLQFAVQALKNGQPLPVAQDLGSVEALGWVATLQQVVEESGRNKEQAAALEAQLSAKEVQLSALARDLEAAGNKKNEVLRVCEEMKLELEQNRGGLRMLVEMEGERDRLAESLKTLTGDMMKKAEQVDRLAAELANLSVAKSASLNSGVR